MIDKKYQIFISSTYTDLIEPRQKVIESILKQYHFPIGMEMFSAADDEQWDIIKETIESSDFYILLIGSRYGSLTAQGIGYTEKEYDYAKEIGVPILTFLKDDTLPTTPQEREADPTKIQKLQNFREKVQDNKMREVWANSDDLAHRVSMALMKEFSRKNRVGWIRGDSISEDASKELVALSKENRELKETISKLEKLTNNRKPELEIAINHNDLLDISIPDTDWGNVITDTPKRLMLEIPEHLIDFITLEDIKKYNAILPDEQKLYEYNQNIKLYFLSRFSLNLKVLIENLGNYRANNISIEIEVPDFVKLFKNSSLEEILFPKDIFPKNPMIKAESEYEASLRNTFSGLGIANYGSGSYIASVSPALDLRRISGLMNQDPMYIVQDNVFTINLPSLLHTRSKNITNKVSIVPLEEGTGDIRINMICEEMEVSKTINIPITVKTDKNLDFNKRPL